MKVYSILEESAEKFGRYPAIADSFGTTTFSELLDEVRLLTHELKRLGVAPGMGVGLRLGNGRHFVAALLALSACDAVVMPIGINVSGPDLHKLLNTIPVHCILTELPCSFISESHRLLGSLQAGTQELRLFLSETTRIDEPFAPHVRDAAFVRPTSGTTGRSKGVVLSHQTVLQRIEAAHQAIPLSPDDRVLCILPMAYHFVVSILLYLRSGALMVVCQDHLARTILDANEAFKGTLLYASPMHIALLADDRSSKRFDTLKLAVSTSGGASPATMKRFHDRYNLPVRQVYGIIEAGLPIGNLAPSPYPLDSVGGPLPGYEAAVFDDGGAQKRRGEVGELAIRGPGMFDAYLSPPLWREEVVRDGWFLTGDLAVCDELGAFRVVGRKKSLIITAGNKVFPEEVENVLNEHPAIQTSRVFGKKHSLVGEVVSAEIVLREDKTLGVDEIRTFCRERLSSFKTPQEVHIVKDIQLTSSGKIVRY